MLHRAGPQFLRADAREIDRGRAVHAGGRRHVGVELVAGNDADAVMLPAIMIVVMVGMRRDHGRSWILLSVGSVRSKLTQSSASASHTKLPEPS